MSNNTPKYNAIINTCNGYTFASLTIKTVDPAEIAAAKNALEQIEGVGKITVASAFGCTNLTAPIVVKEDRAVADASAYIVRFLGIPEAAGLVRSWAFALSSASKLSKLRGESKEQQRMIVDFYANELSEDLRPIVGGGRLLVVENQAKAISEAAIESV